MHRVLKNIALSVMLLSLTMGVSFGIQSEYKNSLVKVELQKNNDNLYNVNLYMQNNFQEPVKIIKKSELNYYILLPETKNNAGSVVLNSKDIRNVTLESFKYEGADVENGYIKININTAKPLNFNVATKLNSAAKLQPKQTVATAIALPIENKQKETPIQKKNSDFKPNKIKEVFKKATPVLKEAIVQNEPEEDLTLGEILQQNDDVVQEFESEEIEVVKEDEDLKNYLEENIDEISQIANANNSLVEKYKKKIEKKLVQYNLKFNDLILMLIVGFFSFLVMFKVLLRKQKNISLKNKKDILAKTEPALIPKEDTTVNNDGKYFIFDNGIKQTGFISPATSEEPKKYELSSYEPDLKDNYVPGSFRDYAESSELDIIQKALKDQAPREYKPATFEEEYKKVCEEKQNGATQNQTQEVKEEVKQEVKPEVEEYVEPEVLSKVEIAPERGFMCVSYKDNINLIGYIFDDVFPLYNLKQTKLEDYQIKYRMADKTPDATNFIIKIDKTKVLVSVTNSSMKLEVVL